MIRQPLMETVFSAHGSSHVQDRRSFANYIYSLGWWHIKSLAFLREIILCLLA